MVGNYKRSPKGEKSEQGCLVLPPLLGILLQSLVRREGGSQGQREREREINGEKERERKGHVRAVAEEIKLS